MIEDTFRNIMDYHHYEISRKWKKQANKRLKHNPKKRWYNVIDTQLGVNRIVARWQEYNIPVRNPTARHTLISEHKWHRRYINTEIYLRLDINLETKRITDHCSRTTHTSKPIGKRNSPITIVSLQRKNNPPLLAYNSYKQIHREMK